MMANQGQEAPGAKVYQKLRRFNLIMGLLHLVQWLFMIVLIGMRVGRYDLGGLILDYALIATVNPFGLTVELHNQTTTRPDWTSFIYGCFGGIVPYLAGPFRLGRQVAG